MILKPRKDRNYSAEADPDPDPSSIGEAESDSEDGHILTQPGPVSPAEDENGNGFRGGAAPPLPTESGELEEAGRPRFSLKTFDSLSLEPFRWYLGSMFGWFASMNMQLLARGFLTFELTGSFASLGLVSLAHAIPGMVLSLPGGVLADRLNKKKVIQAGQVSNMAVSAFIAGLIFSGALTFEWLLFSAVLQGTVNAMIMPARQSLIAEIVSEDRLMNAVALNTAGMNVMRLLAPAGAGLMLAGIGAGWVYSVMSGLYLSGAVLMTRVKLLDPAETKGATQGKKRGRASGPRDLLEGLRYMRRDRVILALLSVNFVIVLLSMPFQTMLPGFVDDVLGGGAGRLGLLMSFVGIGSLAGSLVIASLAPRRRGLMLLVSAAVMGMFLIAFSISTWFWVTAAIMIGVGVGQSGRMSLTNVILMSYTEPAYRGRVMSINMMEFSLMSFGTFMIGVLANIVGIQMAIGSTAVLLLVCIAGALAFVPRLRDLD